MERRTQHFARPTKPLVRLPAFCDTRAPPATRQGELGLSQTPTISPACFAPDSLLNPPDRTGTPADPALVPPRYTTRLFHSAILPDDRSVMVYLPAAYASEPERRFPVLYLHDGQNVFDPRTSYIAGCTWQAHTSADRLAAEGLIEPLILVGVANTGLRRMAEYTPRRDMRLGGGEGDRYGRLLVTELKPLIDTTYRTLPGPENTGLGGSSLGGLISLYLGLEYRDTFGKVAVMSPSVWWDQRSLLTLVRRTSPEPPLRIWLDMGTAEGLRHLRDTDLLYTILLERGWRGGDDLFYLREQDALHNEAAWARRLPSALEFLFPPRAR